MPFSKSNLKFITLILLLTSAAWSASALSQLQKNRYFKAVEAWEKEAGASAVSEKKLRAVKGQALSYMKLGLLYSEFNVFSLDLSEEFYKKLSKNFNSPLLDLYRGQVFYYQGNYSSAQKYLEKVLASKSAPADAVDMAKVYRHFSLQKLKKTKGTIAVKTSEPAVRWQILELGGTTKIPDDLEAKDVRSLRCKMVLMMDKKSISGDELQKMTTSVMNMAEFPEIYLNKGKLTQVNFYDPFVYHALSRAFFYLAQLKYETLKKYESQFPNLAEKLKIDLSMAEALYELERYNEAAKLVENDESMDGLVLLAKIRTKQNKPSDGKKLLGKALKAGKSSPGALRDVGYAYFETNLDKNKALKLTQEALSKRKKTNYYRMHGAVLFGMGKNQESLEVYGKGYKIQFRNSVDHIDPVYMTEYAYTIFKSSKMRYDEVIETLFHIDKAYPACRQLHYTMQGVAAAEATSGSGDKIIRKGG